MASILERLSGALGLGVTPTVVSPKRTIGVGGTAIHGGYIQTREKDSTLVGQEAFTTYSNLIANTAIVAAGLRFFLNLIGKARWSFEPADDSPEAVDAADFVESVLADMGTSWRRVVRRAAMYRFYGFSVQEWTARLRDDGRIGFLDVEPRPQNTIVKWDVDASGTVHGVVQQSPQDYREIYLPRKKCVYVVDDSVNDSPEGLGLFRHIIQAAKDLRRFEQLEGFGFETDLRGIPIGRGPFGVLQDMEDSAEITKSQRQAIEAPLRDFIANHVKTPGLGLLLDSATYESSDEAATPSAAPQWDLDLLNGGTTSQESVAKAIERKQREIARVLGVEHLMLGEGQRGSAALSEDKSKNFALMVDGTLDELVEVFADDLLSPLWDLNGFDQRLKPTAKVEAIQHRNVGEVTQALRDVADAGGTLDPEDPAINEVRELLGLSRAVPVAAPPDVVIPGANPFEDVPAPPGEGSQGVGDQTVETVTDEEGDDA